MDSKADCLAHIPDLPRWVETRALLHAEESVVERHPGGDGFVVWHVEADLGSVVGLPSAASCARLGDAVSEILAFADNIDAVRRYLPAFAAERATVFTRENGGCTVNADSAANGDPAVARHPIRWLEPADLTAHPSLPDELREELVRVVDDVSACLVAALDDGLPVAFAYVASQSETHWDMSIDTLDTHRRRGFAMAAASALMARMEVSGKTAVWGALDSNIASQSLARRLGFVPVDTLWVLEPRDPSVSA